MSQRTARFTSLGVAFTLASGLALSGCRDLTGDPPLPDGTQSPTTYNTPDGARQQARNALYSLRAAMMSVIPAVGVFTDELTEPASNIDRRTIVETEQEIGPVYNTLQNARNDAQFARAAMVRYAPGDSATITQLYAFEGYVDVLLAELFCSGVPLSSVDYGRDFTYQPGSSSTEIYTRAVALFDSASTSLPAVASSDTSLLTLIRVGKGRALLQLGAFDAANQAVANVSTSAHFDTRIELLFAASTHKLFGTLYSSMINREGGNGLPFLQPVDPRAWPDSGTRVDNNTTFMFYYPEQFAEAVQTDSLTIVLASGVEARLIQAEAALRTAPNGSQWLTILNTLRTTGDFTVTLRTDVPGVSPGPVGYPDTTWAEGTGAWLIPASVRSDVGPVCAQADESGVTPPCTDVTWYRGLRPLTDPGASLSGQRAADARVDLLFHERAFWLFLTGHRQGDLRRLVRPTALGGYGRSQQNVYPTGVYRDGSAYGSAVVFPVPSAERVNPYFRGCLSLGA